MPFTQSFDQFFIVIVSIAVTVYLLRTFVGVTLLLIGTIPSRLGHRAHLAGQQVTPRLVLRILSTLLGLLVAGTGVGTTAALAAPHSPDTASTSSEIDLLPAIDRGPFESTTTNNFDDKPGSQKPTSQSSTKKPGSLDTGHTDETKASNKSDNDQNSRRPNSAKMKALPDRSKHRPKYASVTVKPGDSLWAIAERHLGKHATDSEIDQEWRRWYQTNARTIGNNPDFIVPGMKLEAPKS